MRLFSSSALFVFQTLRLAMYKSGHAETLSNCLCRSMQACVLLLLLPRSPVWAAPVAFAFAKTILGRCVQKQHSQQTGQPSLPATSWSWAPHQQCKVYHFVDNICKKAQLEDSLEPRKYDLRGLYASAHVLGA